MSSISMGPGLGVRVIEVEVQDWKKVWRGRRSEIVAERAGVPGVPKAYVRTEQGLEIELTEYRGS